jgi:phosphoribosylformylglycinamidine synthase
VSGKDSLNNTYLDGTGARRAVPPTLVIHAVAAVPDADATVTSDLKAAGNALVLVGAHTVLSFGGSHADLVLGTPEAPGGVPPVDDGAPERYRAVHRLIREGLVRAAHDVSEGGLAVAVAEMAIGGRLGATIVAPDHDPDALALFGEGCGRLVLEVAPEDVPAVQDSLGADAAVLGLVTSVPVVRLGSAVERTVDELRAAWQGGAGGGTGASAGAGAEALS